MYSSVARVAVEMSDWSLGVTAKSKRACMPESFLS